MYLGFRGSITQAAVWPVALRNWAHPSQSPPSRCFQFNRAEPDVPKASSAFHSETFMGVVGEMTFDQPAFNGIVEVNA